MAGAATSIAEQNILSVACRMQADGFAEGEIQAAIAHIKLFNQILCTGGGWEDFQQSLQRGQHSSWVNHAWLLEQPPDPGDINGIRAEMERDPLPMLEKVACPVLAFFGEADTIVPATQNKPLMGNTFHQGGNLDYTIQVWPKATHLFQETVTGSDKEFPLITKWAVGHIASIVDWLSTRVDRVL